jgi:signal transduction histidine kinase
MTSRDGVTLLSGATVSDRADASCDLTHYNRMAALGELASGITHDFRNILQTVISTLDLLETRFNDPAEARRLAPAALRAWLAAVLARRRLRGGYGRRHRHRHGRGHLDPGGGAFLHHQTRRQRNRSRSVHRPHLGNPGRRRAPADKPTGPRDDGGVVAAAGVSADT